MLMDNSLRVETAGSAEEALEYLSRNRPDVIFMDHLMPGMDGFQAVRAIKNNPATATIPIMMYTSQGGELYVGQARALGAIGVLPKQIKPVEVSAVLRSLHLLGDAGPPGGTDEGARAAVAAPVVSGSATGQPEVPFELNERDWADLHRWLQEMFEHFGRELRADFEASMARLLREREAVPAAISPVGQPAARPILRVLLLLILAGVAAVFFWLHLDTQRKWRAAVEHNAALMASLNTRRTVASLDAEVTSRQLDATRMSLDERMNEFVRALEWSVNQSAAYPHDQLPFGDERLAMLTALLNRLQAVGFTGTVYLESHLGDFCYAAGTGESPVLAADTLPAEHCVRAGLSADEARAAAARQSVAFANFLASRDVSSPIRLVIDAHGTAAPVVPYPLPLPGVTAGEWNRAARENNRVLVRLAPDEPTA